MKHPHVRCCRLFSVMVLGRRYQRGLAGDRSSHLSLPGDRDHTRGVSGLLKQISSHFIAAPNTAIKPQRSSPGDTPCLPLPLGRLCPSINLAGLMNAGPRPCSTVSWTVDSWWTSGQHPLSWHWPDLRDWCLPREAQAGETQPTWPRGETLCHCGLSHQTSVILGGGSQQKNWGVSLEEIAEWCHKGDNLQIEGVTWEYSVGEWCLYCYCTDMYK